MSDPAAIHRPVIEAEHLYKSYGHNIAVQDFSFSVNSGEVFGLLGPNGAGKTTAMHMLSGLLEPDHGLVRINGLVDPTRPKVRKSLGIAPQSVALYDKLTASENLMFMGKLQGLFGRELRKSVDRSLELAGLTARRNSQVKTFSGGMKRRLNLACALIHEPEVVLLDEPTVGVDPQSRNHIFERIEQISQQGRTIIYTTHYMEEAQRLCQRVAIVDHGQLLALDTVDALINRHGGKCLLWAELACPPENPNSLPGELDGLSWQLKTDKPVEDLKILLTCGVEIRDLHANFPNLQTVFLNLTGRSLRP